MIQVFRPSLGDDELDALREIFETGWIGLGPKTSEFEEKFATYVGAKYGVGLSSATAALHLACLALGLGAGDEVLVPAITFVSTAHAVAYCGAAPVFVDVEPDTLNIDIEDMERRVTPRTRAVIPVHYGGHACHMDEIWDFADEHGLFVIEDAAHACGSSYKGQRVGGLERSDAACFSFHAVKNLATGDGGMVTTNRVELVNALRKLRWVGIDKSTWDRTEEAEMELETGTRRYANYGWYYEVHELGYKYHMNDIAAAIGLVQLGKLEPANRRRREIVDQYSRGFTGADWIDCPVEKEYASSAWHNYVIKTDYRDAINLYLKEKKIATGVHYMPVHLQPYYRKRSKVSLPVAESVWTRLLTLPLYPDLDDVRMSSE
jgi:perosamine synthetase